MSHPTPAKGGRRAGEHVEQDENPEQSSPGPITPSIMGFGIRPPWQFCKGRHTNEYRWTRLNNDNIGISNRLRSSAFPFSARSARNLFVFRHRFYTGTLSFAFVVLLCQICLVCPDGLFLTGINTIATTYGEFSIRSFSYGHYTPRLCI